MLLASLNQKEEIKELICVDQKKQAMLHLFGRHGDLAALAGCGNDCSEPYEDSL